jgi:hypothetical protein
MEMEMTQSVEAANSKEEKASRTWLMAKALEGDGSPRMCLRDSALEEDDEDDLDKRTVQGDPPHRMAREPLRT